MGIDFFDQMESDKLAPLPAAPFWTIPFDNPEKSKETLDWLNQTFDALKAGSSDRIQEIRKNLAAYKGLSYQGQDTRTKTNRDNQQPIPVKTTKLVVPHLYDMVEQHVSRLTKYRPAFSVMPVSDEHEDKMVAQISEEILDALFYQNDLDEIMRNSARAKRIMRQCYVMVLWNPNKGDLSPAYLNAKKEADGKRIPLLDDKGEQVMSVEGTPLYIDKPVRMGDIEFKLAMAYDIFLQPKPDYKQVEYGFYRECVDVDVLRAENPDKAKEIVPQESGTYWDSEHLEERRMMNKTEVAYFYYKHTTELDSGRYIKFTRDVILVNRDLPYSHGDLPWERYTDVDVPGQLEPISAFELARPVQNQFNNLTSMVIRNQSLFSHPKWMVPKGSVKLESLGNDGSAVQYQGPKPPNLAQSNPTPGEIFSFRTTLKEEIQQVMGVFGVSRGEPPPGIKAGIALQFLDEQENERSNSDVAKHNKFAKGIALKALSVAGDYYDESDQPDLKRVKKDGEPMGRLEKLLGRHKASSAKYFKMSKLSTIYDIRVNNSSALPQQKAARTQTILDYAERFPNLFPEEQIADLLELGQSKKFLDMAAVAVRAADEENEQLLRDETASPPEIWEDHLIHYKIHLREFNQSYYKTSVPKATREAMKDHILATEMFMVELGKRNPAYLDQVGQLFPQFPLFFKAGLEEIVASTQGPIEGELPPEELPPEAMSPDGMPMEAQPLPPEEQPLPPMNEVFPPGAENLGPLPEPEPIDAGLQ